MSEDSQNIEKEDNKACRVKIKYLHFAWFFSILLLFVSFFVAVAQKKEENVKKYDFITIGETESRYSPNGGIFNISENKYLIIGASNKEESKNLSMPFDKYIQYLEVYDNSTKKLQIASKPMFYLLDQAVQMSDKNIFVQTSGKKHYDSFFAILDVKDFSLHFIDELKNIIKPYSIYISPSCLALSNNKVLIYNIKTENNKFLIWDNNIKKFVDGPTYNHNRTMSSAIEIEEDEILIVGGINTHNSSTENKVSEIELCNLKDNSCKVLKSKLQQKKTYPKLFKDNENNILIFPNEIKNNLKIEKYDIKTEQTKDIGNIDKFYDEENPETEKELEGYNKTTGIMCANFVQLKNGNILITGGYSGITMPTVHTYMFLYDISQNKLYKLKNDMKHKRFYHLTTILNDDNILFLGEFSKYIDIFMTQ